MQHRRATRTRTWATWSRRRATRFGTTARVRAVLPGEVHRRGVRRVRQPLHRQQRRGQDRGRVREQRRVPEYHRPLQAGLCQDRRPRRRQGQGHLQPHVRARVPRRVSRARGWSVFEVYFPRDQKLRTINNSTIPHVCQCVMPT